MSYFLCALSEIPKASRFTIVQEIEPFIKGETQTQNNYCNAIAHLTNVGKKNPRTGFKLGNFSRKLEEEGGIGEGNGNTRIQGECERINVVGGKETGSNRGEKSCFQ